MSIEQVRSCKGYNNIDTNIIVPHLIKENHFYVGYNSAICIHGINSQPFLAQQVVVNKQMKPSIYGRIVNQYTLFSMISDPDLTIDGWVENKEIDRSSLITSHSMTMTQRNWKITFFSPDP